MELKFVKKTPRPKPLKLLEMIQKSASMFELSEAYRLRKKGDFPW